MFAILEIKKNLRKMTYEVAASINYLNLSNAFEHLMILTLMMYVYK